MLPLLVIILCNCSSSEKKSSITEDTLVTDKQSKDSIIKRDSLSDKKDSLPREKKIIKENSPNSKSGRPGSGSGSDNPRYMGSEPRREPTQQQRLEEYERQRRDEIRPGIPERKEPRPKVHDTGVVNNSKFLK